MSNRVVSGILTIALLWLPTALAAADGEVLIPAPPSLAARSYVLMDADSGRVLVAHGENLRQPPASLTKMMTSYVLSTELAKGNVHNDDLVPVSRNAWAQNPAFKGSSRMFIEVGKQVRLGDLHKGIVISSGNDATVAVAEYLAGSEAAFADIMNQRAERLGMSNTNFTNSHGLPEEGEFSTAMDMALLAQAVIRDFPEDYVLYSQRSFTFNGISQANRNKLLWQDPTVDGLKTGYTKAAGYCLVASAERDDMRLIAVVMGASSADARARENQQLLQYGFRYYETLKLYGAGERVATSRVWSGADDRVAMGVLDDVYITLPRGQREALKAEMEYAEVIEAPVASGQKLGELRLTLSGEPIWLETPTDDQPGRALQPELVALESVEAGGIVARLWDAMMLFFYQLFGMSTSQVS